MISSSPPKCRIPALGPLKNKWRKEKGRMKKEKESEGRMKKEKESEGRMRREKRAREEWRRGGMDGGNNREKGRWKREKMEKAK